MSRAVAAVLVFGQLAQGLHQRCEKYGAAIFSGQGFLRVVSELHQRRLKLLLIVVQYCNPRIAETSAASDRARQRGHDLLT